MKATLSIAARVASFLLAGAATGLLLVLVAGVASAASSPPATSPARATSGPVVVLSIDGAIDPINAQYVSRGLQQAASERARAVLIELNTPGGLDSSMREITGAMLTSPVPVIVYVTPAGARAGSAGVFILMASDVAAMAPGTNVGAAHPVSGGASTGSNLPDDERAKATNDAAAYMRMLATTRHHNATWAEDAVRQSVALTADEALRQHVVDQISPDRQALLTVVDGMPYVRNGQTATFDTRGAPIQSIGLTVPEQLLHVIDDPNISYLLLTIGAWALLAEVFHPGSVVPGVVGVICLALALTAFESLPMNWTGVGLIALAIGLFILDLKAASHGVLTGAGLITFIVGSLMLFSPVDLPALSAGEFGLAVSPVLIVAIGLGLAFFFSFAVRATLRARRRPAMAISSAGVGATGLAVTELAPSGSVRIHGANWNADAVNGVIHQGETVQITARQGLRLLVRRVDQKGT
ncbi:MAG: NfeD family protein [Chloroflexota bacterium]